MGVKKVAHFARHKSPSQACSWRHLQVNVWCLIGRCTVHYTFYAAADSAFVQVALHADYSINMTETQERESVSLQDPYSLAIIAKQVGYEGQTFDGLRHFTGLLRWRKWLPACNEVFRFQVPS